MHRDVPKVLDCGERLIALGHQHGLPFYQTIGNIMHGWALVRLGRVMEGLPALRQAISRYRATSVVMISLLTTMLAEAELGAGVEQEGMDHLEASDRDAVSRNQLFWRAGILHLKGERLAARDGDIAEVCLRASLELARGQQAKSLELRAATGLARLFQQQGRRDEACDLLAPVYGWFTEGFDTLDLKQAKTLLDQLA
jgi:predicted ATPase